MSAAADETAEIVARLRGWVSSVRGRLPLYSRLIETAADRPEIHRMLLDAPRPQRLPVLLLAAVHAVVLDDPTCALARFYPDLTDPPDPGDPADAFVELCAERESTLRTLIAMRTVQTNEVGRCALLLPVLGIVEAEVGALGLVDVGTSAGLNLAIDRYGYEYEPGGRVGASSPVELQCSVRGEVPIPSSMPVLAGRVGLDRSPVDIDDDNEARWLEACVWPEQPERFHRLRAAIAVARELRPHVVRGDAVDDLGLVVDEIGDVGHPVITNTWVLNYLEPRRRREYVERVEALGRARDLSWVYAESPREVSPEVPTTDDAALADKTVVSLVRWRSGDRTVAHLAAAQPHGRWINWL